MPVAIASRSTSLRLVPVVLGVLAAAASIARATDEDAQLQSPFAFGERALRVRLASAYPAVTQWEVVPLRPTGKSVAPAPVAVPLSADVIRLGVRSAVWVRPAKTSSRGELLWYSVAGYGAAVTATRRLVKGAALEARDGTLTSSDLVVAGCTSVGVPTVLEGMRTRISIGEGAVICSSAIEQRPPVERGDEVTVRYVSGPVALTSRAVAQADGLLGKSVMVRSTASGDVYRAKVSGKAEVSVND